MCNRWLGWVVLGCAVAAPLAAHAATSSDALAQCLIRSTTPADQRVALRWAFATMALDPELADMAQVDAAQREALNQQAGALVSSLLADSCGGPVQQTLQAQGVAGVQAAFAAWGRWAITGVVTEPHVAAGMGQLLSYLDLGKLMNLLPLLPAPGNTGG